MAKKSMYFAEAERMYVIEQMTSVEISQRLDVCERTVRLWKDEGDWDTKRKQYLDNKASFHEELYCFGRKLLKSIEDDLTSGTEPSQARLYLLNNILSKIGKVKTYEEETIKSKSDGEDKDKLIEQMKEMLGLD